MTAQEILNKTIPPIAPLGIVEGQLFDSSGRSATNEIINAMTDYGQQESIGFAIWISQEGYLRLSTGVDVNGWIKIDSPAQTITTESLYKKFKQSNHKQWLKQQEHQ